MKIEEIDQNFASSTAIVGEYDYYDVKDKPFSLHGIFYDEERGGYLRIPQKIADTVNEGVKYLVCNTAGGRVRFSTDANQITLAVKYKGLSKMPHMALSGNSGFSLCQNFDDEEHFLAIRYPEYADENGFIRSIPLQGEGMRYYTLHFPLYHYIDSVHIGIEKGRTLGEGKPYKNIAPILYYGSSITQGGCASRADNSYQGFISKRNNVDFINLGFSGNAKAEPQMADYLATVECSVFVMDYDWNAPSAEYLRKTHYPFYTRYRAKRPTTPIIFISKPDFHADVEGEERVAIIKATYERAKNEGDENVYFIDGRTLFGEDWNFCTVDGTHPTDLGFFKMSKVIGSQIDALLERQK